MKNYTKICQSYIIIYILCMHNDQKSLPLSYFVYSSRRSHLIFRIFIKSRRKLLSFVLKEEFHHEFLFSLSNVDACTIFSKPSSSPSIYINTLTYTKRLCRVSSFTYTTYFALFRTS